VISLATRVLATHLDKSQCMYTPYGWTWWTIVAQHVVLGGRIGFLSAVRPALATEERPRTHNKYSAPQTAPFSSVGSAPQRSSTLVASYSMFWGLKTGALGRRGSPEVPTWLSRPPLQGCSMLYHSPTKLPNKTFADCCHLMLSRGTPVHPSLARAVKEPTWIMAGR
jgi:hypothetical protein